MKRAALLGGAALAALAALEVALRLASYSTPQLHQLDVELGWSLRANKSGSYAAQDGRIGVAINSAGFRDREHLLDKPDPVYRIAVLGDEYSESMGIALRDTWWWRLEPELQRCDFQPGKLVEVLNFGVAGYGTAQELVLLQRTAMRYAPDLVLLQFSADDVIDNSFALAPTTRASSSSCANSRARPSSHPRTPKPTRRSPRRREMRCTRRLGASPRLSSPRRPITRGATALSSRSSSCRRHARRARPRATQTSVSPRSARSCRCR